MRQSAVPLWAQIERAIREMIHAGKYKVGDRLPAEPELAAMFGVSRMTIRQAVQKLVHEGLLTRGRGLGTFVSRPPLVRALNSQYLDGFFATLQAQGHAVVSQVLRFERQPAEEHVAEALRLPPGAQVFRLERLRLVDGDPLSIQITYLPVLPLPTLDQFDFSCRSLYDVLRTEYDLPILAIDQRISAKAASPVQARLMHISPGFPLLYVEKTSRTTDEREIEFGQLYFNPTVYQLTMAIRP